MYDNTCLVFSDLFYFTLLLTFLKYFFGFAYKNQIFSVQLHPKEFDTFHFEEFSTRHPYKQQKLK